MATDTLVENQIDYGQKLVDQLAQLGFEVAAGCWLKTSVDGRWRFYLVSPIVETEGLAQAYRRLHPLIRQIPQPFSFDPVGVQLLGPTDPIARDVLAALRLIPGPRVSPRRWDGIWLGNRSIEGAYLYSPPDGVAV